MLNDTEEYIEQENLADQMCGLSIAAQTKKSMAELNVLDYMMWRIEIAANRGFRFQNFSYTSDKSLYVYIKRKISIIKRHKLCDKFS